VALHSRIDLACAGASIQKNSSQRWYTEPPKGVWNMSALTSFATSFLQTFSFRSFIDRERGTRPGMEDGLFPYDESTEELFEPPRVSPLIRWSEIASALGSSASALGHTNVQTDIFLQDVEAAVNKILAEKSVK
jgi:hypothetical protein